MTFHYCSKWAKLLQCPGGYGKHIRLNEIFGICHLALDVTNPRVVIFRDAILDPFQVELGSRRTSVAYSCRALLSYVGGAIICFKVIDAHRIRLLARSWSLAQDGGSNKDRFAILASAEEAGQTAAPQEKTDPKGRDGETGAEHAEVEGAATNSTQSFMHNAPMTFKEVLQLNAAVIGFGSNMWMNEVPACFDSVVSNVTNLNGLVEVCDILVCRTLRVAIGKVNIAEYNRCMLASLRPCATPSFLY